MSITSVLDLLTRIPESSKPCRILYISDFDPAGDEMPTSVARQIEFWLNKRALGLDIKLNPLVLTREQVIKYRLPRKPVKDSDRRKASFEERHGEVLDDTELVDCL